MSRTYTVTQYLAHFFRSKRWDSFHSPFLFSLFTYCTDERMSHPLFESIEGKRRELIQSKEVIERNDFGTGTSFHQSKNADSISRIARHALSLPFQCRFLYRLAVFTKSRVIVELGTSLGISSSYLGIANSTSRVDTVEGDAEIASTAHKVFDSLILDNIHLHNTSFDSFIANGLPGGQQIDLLFLDGHHTSAALWKYYHALRPFMTDQTIIIVDDIYWSVDMTNGWNKLISLPEVTQSVDCFYFGLLFFRQDFFNHKNHCIRLPLRGLLPGG
ncbi:MAG: class I SAM-dependent methyltransferase [Saprospiraceae bacterium]|nr:class I SAM-dependent methyltransferase [Saprospiraceae bacterium]